MAQTLEHNSTVVSVTPVNVPLLDDSMEIVRLLDDEPNDVGGLSAAELKEVFDEAGERIKAYINGELIPAVVGADLTEQTRLAAENERVANEQERVGNENARVEAENRRAGAEPLRISAEEQRIAAENERIAAEAARAEAEAIRQEAETGYVAQAKQSAESAAESARKAAEDAAKVETAVGGDFVTNQQFAAHNTDTGAHADIRAVASNAASAAAAAQQTANSKEASGTAASAVSAHNASATAHEDIRAAVASLGSGKADATHTQSASTIGAGTFTGLVKALNLAVSMNGVRNITASTDDLTAGTSALATGNIYFVYE